MQLQLVIKAVLHSRKMCFHFRLSYTCILCTAWNNSILPKLAYRVEFHRLLFIFVCFCIVLTFLSHYRTLQILMPELHGRWERCVTVNLFLSHYSEMPVFALWCPEQLILAVHLLAVMAGFVQEVAARSHVAARGGTWVRPVISVSLT